MTWDEIALWIGLTLIGGGLLLVGVWIGAFLLVGWMQHRTPGAPIGEAPDDDTMAIADAVRETLRRQVDREQRIRWRASEAWMAYAVEDFDWHAAEHMVRRVR